jgi:NAD(P)-dependent dehydrogenase (short-subunit alcohol dehydrogenase family)
MELENAAALVTGASEGLGAALARALARAGARVVAVARRREPVERMAAAARAEGLEVHALIADISDKHAVYPLVGAAAALVGPLDVVIHNASTLGPVPLRPLLDTECEDLETVLETNLVGPFRLTRAVAGNMAVRGQGLVVHITSDASVQAYPSWGAYGVSKAGLDHLGRIWAAELEGTGVRFLTVDPGEMDTRMHADAIPGADRSALSSPDDVARRIVELIRTDRFGSGARVEVPPPGVAR